MRVTFILVCCLVFYASASTYSQNTRLTLNLQNATILELIQDIESQSKFIFLYQASDLNLNKRVSADFKNATIEEILDVTLKKEGISYEVFEKQILISKDEPLVPNGVMQQQRKLLGIVTGKDGQPIPGVTVVVKGTNIGTNTDIDGRFTLTNIPDNVKILVFSFVGMKSQEVAISGKTTFNVAMIDEAVGLDDVVVVGYGFQKKESVVGAITQVSSESLLKSGNSNITNAIAGKLSGVLTIQQSGEPGANSSEIVVRGLSSWNGSAPLVLVDGVERDFKSLDPNEINTISVLKDASATAVFGAKGANGVVIVTTKRGKIGKPQIDFSTSYGMQKATMIPDHISSYQTMLMYNAGNMNNGTFQNLKPQNILNEYRNPSTPLNALRYPDVNWFDLLTRPFASTINSNFNISGGTNFVKYFCSLGYVYEGDFFDAVKSGLYDMSHSYKKFNYRTNIDFQLTKSSTLSFNLGGQTGLKNSTNWVTWANLSTASPAAYPAYFPAWVLEQVPDPDYPNEKGNRFASSVGQYYSNPYTSFNGGQFNQDIDTKLFTDILFDQKLDFVTKGLSLAGKVAMSTYFINRILLSSTPKLEYQLNYNDIGKPGVNPWFRNGQGNEYYEKPPIDMAVGGSQSGYYSDLYYEFGLNYANTFGRHTVTGLALMNRSQKNKGTEFAYYNEALVGRGTYDYSHKYLLEVNIGYTGSERFAPGNRFGFFPSGALGWVVSEENFFKNAVPWMNKLKLRYSDGLTGSDAAGSRWLYNSGYYSDNANFLHEDMAANTSAQWEEAHKRDLGIELGLFKNVLRINADFFDEYRDKMLLTPRSVTMLVGNSFKDLNLGKLKKHGFELEVEFNKVTPSNLNYWVKGMFGFNENRIIFKDDPIYAADYTKDVGKPLGAKLGGVILTGSGYYTSVNDIHNNISALDPTKLNVGDYKYLDYNVDGKVTNLDRCPIKGSDYPPVTYSFSSGFTYKNFEFSFMFQGNVGKYITFSNTYENEFIKGDLRVHTSQLDYWSPVNPTANHATIHYGTSVPANISWGADSNTEGRHWRNSDYVRLKEVYIGYNMSSGFLNHLMGVSNLLFYATGNNLWTLTSLIEGDPERKSYSDGDSQDGFYPQMSSVKLGVKVAF